MKTAVIISKHIPSHWAHSINTVKHAGGFFKLGHEVEIFTVEGDEERKEKEKIKDVHEFYDINKKIKINYFRNNKNPDQSIIFDCKKKQISLLYCRSYKATYYGIKKKLSVIMESHTPHTDHPDLKEVIRLSSSKYFKGLVTISKKLKDNFVKAGVPKEKILVVEDAVDLDKFDKINDCKEILRKKLNLPLDKKIVMYIGSLYDGRGIDTILKTASYLNNGGILFIFIGGSQAEIKKWKDYMKDNKIENENISFLGYKINKEVPSYLKSADLLLAPYSLKCPTIKWISPMKFFEYMASKVPFIASNVKRMREICNNGECLFFKTDSAKDLGQKILMLIGNKKLQRILIKNAYEKSKRHTYKKRCKKIIEFACKK